MMGQIYLSLRFYLFGEQAVDAVARAEPVWQEWVGAHFPMPAVVGVAD